MAPWIDTKVTLGNVINLVTLFLAGAGFYWTTTYTLSQHTREIESVLARTERLDRENVAYRERIRADIQTRADKTAEQQGLLIQRTIAVEVELKGLRSDIQRIIARVDGGVLH